ncbi:MAG TPA: NAD-dependent epimerase/dehydratase family protein [Candidatus Bipolaricaulota bacterium]|nr:NAD-dependent epimerase/dehydratase family protein [Candidatus Bipolaricaulota bacterium]
MAKQSKNILVLGGAGFIGSYLCERLVKAGFNVICVDNFSSSSQLNINHLLQESNFELIKHDMAEPLLDLEEIEDVAKFQINVYGIQEIYNLACPTSVKNFEAHQIQTILANTIAVKNALDLAVKYKAKFMQFSSSVIYGDVPKSTIGKPNFIKEDYRGLIDHLEPRACYDQGKKYAETIVDVYHRQFDLDTKIVRIFRTFGPRMLLKDGQMIPDFIINALDNKDLEIFGDENFITSICYVSDIVEGAVTLMDSPLNDPVNMGGTTVHKLVDVANKIKELTNSSSNIVFKESLLFMRELGYPDIGRIKKAIGWFPIVSLEDGLNRTIEYTKAHKNLVNFSSNNDEA